MTKQRLWKSMKYRDGKIVSNYDKSEWIVGEWRENPYPVVKECEGLNCCACIVDAIWYVMGDVIAEVEIRGVQITGDDKITAQEMRIIRAWRWTPLDSVAMAIHAAELVIGYYDEKCPNDDVPRKAIEAAKNYLANPTKPLTSNAADAAYAAANAASAAAYAASSARAAACAAANAACAAANAACAAANAASAAAYAASSARAAACAAADAASAAAYAASAAAYAASSARAAAYAAARKKMKAKIDKWIITRLKDQNQLPKTQHPGGRR